jgi:LacI family transcriptional regulator
VEGAREGAGSATLEVLRTPDTTIEHGRAVGEEIAARAPAERPDGIFAGNDLVALGLLNAFTRARIRVPEDIAIVGYDDIALARSAHVPLTSVRQPREEMGAAAVRIIEEERLDAKEERHLRLHPELVIRSSSIGA